MCTTGNKHEGQIGSSVDNKHEVFEHCSEMKDQVGSKIFVCPDCSLFVVFHEVFEHGSGMTGQVNPKIIVCPDCSLYVVFGSGLREGLQGS